MFDFSPLCVFKCAFKLPALEDAYSHWLHLFDFSPHCVFSHVSSNGLLEHVGFCYHFGKKLHVSLSDGGDRSISWTAMVSTDHFLPSRAELHSRAAEQQSCRAEKSRAAQQRRRAADPNVGRRCQG